MHVFREEHFDSVTTIDGDVRSACQLKPLRTVYGFQASDFVIFDSTSDAQIARVSFLHNFGMV